MRLNDSNRKKGPDYWRAKRRAKGLKVTPGCQICRKSLNKLFVRMPPKSKNAKFGSHLKSVEGLWYCKRCLIVYAGVNIEVRRDVV